MDDDLLLDDAAFDDLELLEELENNLGLQLPPAQAQQQQQQSIQNIMEDNNGDEFDDQFGDDLDMEELVQVEQQATNNNHDGNISFVPPEGNDPMPPPRLPVDTQCFHPLDLENLRTWIYPTNYPIRGYQYNIVQKALFSNTLVALPTGLGKTFIAAVVMYNYWRWFPNSKIIFMAPTRPLVTQQIEACFSICGLPQEDTIDISGSTAVAKRKDYWKSKRVFFATPQTVQNDLKSNGCPAEKVVCLVVDEAHKATGNYAFVEVVRMISKKNRDFRVLALTATPGAKIDIVQNVVDNLKIANIKIRTEESMDILPFTHGKNVEKVVVKLSYTEGGTGLVPKVMNEFRSQVLQPLLDQLHKLPSNIQQANANQVSTYGLTANRTYFTATAHNLNSSLKYSIISKYLAAEQMSRAYDMLYNHGIAPFVESIENSIQEQQASGKKMSAAQTSYYNHPTVKRLLTELKREMLNPNFVGHPKIDQLVAILLKHFTNLPPNANSKVMVFSSFRSSVTEICRVLDQHNPLIRSSYFVGQSDGKMGTKGLKQKEQQEVIQKFKRDEFNVLVATSVGEEGLDIGEVDIIICYDSQTSPIRMLQRMGRTGRKRQGKCIMLLTETEERKYTQAKETYDRIQRQISQGTELNYYKENPSIIPPNYKPTICRKVLDIGKYKQQQLKRRRLTSTASDFATPSPDYENDGTGFLKQDAEQVFVRSFNTRLDTFINFQAVKTRYWPTESSLESLQKHVPWQTEPTSTYRVGHSRRTINFTGIVKKMEHRIQYPNEEIKFDVPKRRQTALILPTKMVGGKASSSLVMPKRKKKATATLNEAFHDFMDQTGAATHFMDHNGYDDDNFRNDGDDFADAGKNRIHDFFTPKPHAAASSSKKVSPSISTKELTTKTKLASPKKSPAKSLPVKDKGKGKMLEAIDEDSFDMMDTDWPAILPDEVYTSIEPLVDHQPLSATELKFKKQWKAPHPTKPLEKKMDVYIPVHINKEIPKRHFIQEDNDEEDDEFGMLDNDFSVDDLFIVEKEALILQGFGDELDPIFPFEQKQEQQRQHDIPKFALVWTQSKPIFRDKALALLDQKQKALHAVTGKFLAMSLFPQYNNTSSKVLNDLPAKTLTLSRPVTTPSPIIPSRPVTIPDSTVISPKSSTKPSISRPSSLSPSRLPSLPVLPSLPPSIPTSPQKQNQGAALMDSRQDDILDRQHNILIQAAIGGVQQHLQEHDDDDMISIHNSDTSTDEEDGFDNINFNEMTFADFLENKIGYGESNSNGESKKRHTVTNNHDAASQLMKKKVSLYSKPSLSKKKQLYKSPSPPSSPSPLPLPSNGSVTPEHNSFDSPLEDFAHFLSPPLMMQNKLTHNAKQPTASPTSPSNLDGENNEINISLQPIVDDENENSVILISETVPQRDHATTPIQSSISTHRKDKASPKILQRCGSPSPSRILPQLSKGIYPPSASPIANSPLRLGQLPLRSLSPKPDSLYYRPLLDSPARQLYSPLGKRTIATSDSEESPLIPVMRRKRRVIEESPNTNLDDDNENSALIPGFKPKKRLKRKASTPSTSENSHIFEEDDQDNEDLVFVPPSRAVLLQKLKQSSKEHDKPQVKKKMSAADLLENPFVDAEAEESSDEGHSGDEDEDDQENMEQDSFIVNDESLLEEATSLNEEEEESHRDHGSRKKHHGDIYRQSLMNDDICSRNRKHWMNRFDADKWLNANQENDSIIEEEKEDISVEQIDDSASEVDLANKLPSDPISQDDDDDDFM